MGIENTTPVIGTGGETIATVTTNQTDFVPTTDIVFLQQGLAGPTSIQFAPYGDGSAPKKKEVTFYIRGAAGDVTFLPGSGENFIGGDTSLVVPSPGTVTFWFDQNGQIVIGDHTVADSGSGASPEYAIIGDFVWSSSSDTQVVINEAGSGLYFNLPTDHQTLEGTVAGAPSWLSKAGGSSPVVINGPGTFMVEAWPQNSLAGVSTDDARFSVGQAVLNMPGVGVLMKQTAGALEQYMSVKLGPFVLAEGESIAPALFFEITNGTGDLGTGDLTPWIVITKLS